MLPDPARLGFCGAHAQAVPCRLQLTGKGAVDVTASVVANGEGVSLSTVWRPVPVRATVQIAGTCSPEFEAALRSMYLTAIHRVEVPVLAGVAGRQSVTLEDYGWLAEIE
jgi:hypothetical protein